MNDDRYRGPHGLESARLLRDYPEVTDTPWLGPDATTGFTVQQFAENLSMCKAPRWAKRAAVAVCRSYGIRGICDPAYIANVIFDTFQRDLPRDIVRGDVSVDEAVQRG